MLVPLNPTSMCVHVPSNTSGSDFKYKHRSTMHQPPFTPAVGAPDPSVPWFGPPTPGTARSNRSVEPLGRTARSPLEPRQVKLMFEAPDPTIEDETTRSERERG